MNPFKKALELGDELLDKTVIGSYTNLGYHLRRLWWDEEKTAVPMDGKVCIVTGATAGLGRVVAERLAGLGAEVCLVARSPDRGTAAWQEIIAATGNHRVYLEIADLSLQADIRDLVKRFSARSGRLDVLINNAGVLMDKHRRTAEGIEVTYATNTLGYFLLTNLMLPLLKQSAPARVINVSSGGMYLAALNVDDPQFERRPFDGTLAYAESKRAEVEFTRIWAEQLAGSGIAVHAVHPGWADTPGVQRSLPTFHTFLNPLLRTPEQGADTILWLAVNPDLPAQENGQFWFDRQARPVYKWGSPRNSADEIRRFWNDCCRITGWRPSEKTERIISTDYTD